MQQLQKVQNKDIPRRLEISVSFLKGKLLRFIYWKRVKNCSCTCHSDV